LSVNHYTWPAAALSVARVMTRIELASLDLLLLLGLIEAGVRAS
jgi:hypothetical protein